MDYLGLSSWLLGQSTAGKSRQEFDFIGSEVLLCGL